MSNDDLIKRSDAVACVQLGKTFTSIVNAINALPAENRKNRPEIYSELFSPEPGERPPLPSGGSAFAEKLAISKIEVQEE